MRYLLTGTTSKRLSYRPMVQDDYEAWLPFFKREEAVQAYKFSKEKSAEIHCQEWVDRHLTRYKESKGGLNALIEIKSGSLVGFCGLLIQEIDDVEELEIGYALLPEFWRKGFAIEAASHCKAEAFARQWANSLISIITPDNLPSQKVAKRNGMIHEKNSAYRGFDVMIFRVMKGKEPSKN